MDLQNISLTQKDFDDRNWQEIVANSGKQECYEYSSGFFAKAMEVAKNSDDVGREIYALLGNATFLHFDYKSNSEPYGPVINQGNSQIRLIDTFNDDHLSIFDELLKSGISDSEMKARIADILWVRKRNYQAANIAIDAYLLSAANLEQPEHWNACYRRIERALRIAVMLGREQKGFQDSIAYIAKVLDSQNGEDPLYLSNKLMLLLLEHKVGDKSKYAKLSKKLAKRAEKKKDWEIARTHWATNARWHARQEDSESERKALIRVAELYVEQAKMSASKMGAATYQQKAVEAFRQIGGLRDEVENQHKVLLKYQKDSLQEMAPISTPINIPEEVKELVKSVRDKPFREAILELCLIHTPQNVEQLRKEVKEQLNQTPLQFLSAGVIVNEQGHVTGQHTSMWSDDPSQIEKAYREHMFRNAQFGQGLAAQMVIEPARNEISLQHSARVEDFFFLTSNNPFIPRGREYIFAYGLHAGLSGDFIVSTHVLIPQIENSIRCLLERQGIRTSALDSKGIQDQRNLNALLYDPYQKELLKIFGEDIVFEFQGLLVERFGSNLRNKMAHGLMSSGEFYSYSTVYLWWLVLRICCLPILHQLNTGGEETDSESDTEA